MHMRRRRNIRRQRVFRDHKNPIDIYDDVELYERIRFRRNDILGIVDEIRDDIEYPATRQGSLQLLITLRYYATGSFQNTVVEMIGISQPTASRTIHRSHQRDQTTHGPLGTIANPTRSRPTKGQFVTLGRLSECVGLYIDRIHV